MKKNPLQSYANMNNSMGFSKVPRDAKTTLQTLQKSPQSPDPVCTLNGTIMGVI